MSEEYGQPLARAPKRAPQRGPSEHRLARGTSELPSSAGQELERRAPPQQKPSPAPYNGQPLMRDVGRRTAIDGTPGMRGQIVKPIPPEVLHSRASITVQKQQI